MPAAGLTFCHGVLRCTSKQCLTFAQAKIKHEQYYREPCAWIALAKQCFSGSNSSKHAVPIYRKMLESIKKVYKKTAGSSRFSRFLIYAARLARVDHFFDFVMTGEQFSWNVVAKFGKQFFVAV